MNKSSHQVLTIKAIHYATVPRDCVCKILQGVKDRRKKHHSKWFRWNTPTKGHLTATFHAIKLWLQCTETKVNKSLFATEVSNHKDEVRKNKKRKRCSNFPPVTYQKNSCRSSAHLPLPRTSLCMRVLHCFLQKASWTNGCIFLPLRDLTLLFNAFLALAFTASCHWCTYTQGRVRTEIPFRCLPMT